MEKRKAAAQEEMDKLKKAKELQKKMGKALMRNVLQSREEQEKEKADQEELDRRAALAKPIKPRKSVTFAEEGPEIVDGVGKREKGKTMDWGDVAPGTLRKASDATNGFAERQTMKLNVVERPLTSLRSPGPPPRDSDDESEPETATTQDSEDEENLRDMFSRYRMQSPPPPSIDSEDESLADEEPSEWNDEDFDTARHQREVALAYYEKRKTIGAEVSNAMRAHTHEHDGNGWDQPVRAKTNSMSFHIHEALIVQEVPLEATLASTPPKPTASRFKADRLANAPSTTGLASHSLGASVLSANTAPMKRAIRMGRLENGKLIGGDDGDSDEDITAEDENAKQFLEMLRNGEVTNVGPLDISVKPTSQEQTPSAQPVDPSQKHRDTTEPSVSSKVSKFKLALSQPDLTTGQTSPSLASGGHTPILSATRSSPKMSSGYSSGTSSPTQLPQYNPAGPSRVGGIASRQMPGMVVESPSFVRPSGMPFQPLQSVILESPSFQPPSSNTSTASSTPTLVSTPTLTSLNGFNGSASPGGSAAPTPTPIRAGVIERRPPTVTARTPETARPMAGNAEQPQKVSRFKAQRS